jgi:UPF0755 protein
VLSLKKFSLSFFFFLAFAALLFGVYRQQLKPTDPRSQEEVVFVIPQGQNASTIASRLQRDGFIRNSLVFKLLLNRYDLSSRLQAGSFRLSKSMNLDTIIQALTHGSLDFWITFPEGLRVEEYAQRLNKEVNIDVDEFILAAKPYEGQLFPDTYLIPQTATAQDVVDILLTTFSGKSPTEDPDTIIIASLIEREAKHAVDRSLVSSVIHNRLRIGMPLQIDATVQYILGNDKLWWKNNLTRAELQTTSPFNTYLNPGLPPRPIVNPGLAALEAAVNPATTDYLYYISDSGGFNHYATDLDGHNQNIAEYLNP